jgi:hypothetical protein
MPGMNKIPGGSLVASQLLRTDGLWSFLSMAQDFASALADRQRV